MIVSDVTRVDISSLMEDIHQEYIKHCHDNNKEASFDRTNLPDSSLDTRPSDQRSTLSLRQGQDTRSCHPEVTDN